MATSTGGDGGQNSSQFLTTGSSALILAFLAIGLFVGGLLVMFAMRRYVVLSRRRAGLWGSSTSIGPWNWEEPAAAYASPPPLAIGLGTMRRRREADVGARPVLYEMQAIKAGGDKWEDIMPLSAKAEFTAQLPAAPPQEHAPNDSSDGSRSPHASSGFLRPFAIGVHDFVSQIRPSRRHADSLAPAPLTVQPHPTPALEDGPMSARSEEPSYLRVALAIAMPAPQPCASGVPLYALGISDVRWSGGPLEDLQPQPGREASAEAVARVD